MASACSVLYWPVLATLLFVAFLLLLWFVWDVIDKRSPQYRAMRQFPGPPVLPLVGTAYHTRGLDPAKTFDAFRRYTHLYGGSYRFWLNTHIFVLNITRCREAEPFLSGVQNTEKSHLYRFLHPFIGVGLLNSSGEKWLQRRRILTPAFHFNILNGFHRTFCEESEQLAAQIDKAERTDGAESSIELQSMMSQYTLNTICGTYGKSAGELMVELFVKFIWYSAETSMGVKLDSMDGAKAYRDGIYKVGEMMLIRAVRPWLYLDWTYNWLGYSSKLQTLLKPLHRFTIGIINQRRELFQQGKLDNLMHDRGYDQGNTDSTSFNGKKRYAMLDTLLAAECEGLIDREGIREEVDTFTFEGHDTTGAALVFVFLTLSWEQDVQERLYQELRQLKDEKSLDDYAHFSPGDLSSLKYFDRVIKECFRLWPPVPFISRRVTEEVALPDGRTIPRDCIAALHIFDMHRDPEQFPDPDRFDPDRFLAENVAKRNPYAYVPFSAGQRNCIGQKYALLEVKTAVAYLVLRYRVLPATKRSEIQLIADLVLRASTPLKVRFERRSD